MTATTNIPLNPLQVKGKGRPAETTNSHSHKKGEGKAGTKQLPSAVELAAYEEAAAATAIPPSTAPAVLQKAEAEAITTTEIGLHQVELVGDSLIPGTQPPRA